MDIENPLPPIVWAAKDGPPALLERLLRAGGNPNSDDGFGGTCIMASACYFQPECTRLLIAHGADVTYAYSGDNATVLYMMAYCFQDGRDADRFEEEGDYVLTADLLIEAGAPMNVKGGERGVTALELLQEMQVTPGTKVSRERDGLISLLQGQYWRDWGNENPFLLASLSPDEAVWLFMKGAANRGRDDASVDKTRVRSISPGFRRSVLQALYRHEKTFKAFLHILFVVQTLSHPLCAFQGMQCTVLALVAEFAGVSGVSLLNARQATASLEELLGDSMEEEEEAQGSDEDNDTDTETSSFMDMEEWTDDGDEDDDYDADTMETGSSDEEYYSDSDENEAENDA